MWHTDLVSKLDGLVDTEILIFILTFLLNASSTNVDTVISFFSLSVIFMCTMGTTATAYTHT